jgi:hypothetical protein
MNAFYTKDHLVNEGLIILMDKLANNYDCWSDSIKLRNGNDSDYRDKQAEKFRNTMQVETTKKYYKILVGDPEFGADIWGYIVRANDSVQCSTSEAYFSRGDILKKVGKKNTFKKYNLGNIMMGNPNNYDKPNPDYPDFKTYWTGAK